MKIKVITLFILSNLFINFSYAEKVIAMSDQYYQGKYFLVSQSKSRNINTVIYKTVFKAETVF